MSTNIFYSLPFNIEAYQKYKLTCQDLFFIAWIQRLSMYPKIEVIINEDEEKFYWIKYSKILSDLKIFYPNIYKLQTVIRRLTSKEKEPRGIKPLILKIVHQKAGKGVKTYFAIDHLVMDEILGGTKVDSLLTGEPIREKVKTLKQKVPVNKNVLKIFKNIKTVTNNVTLFSHEKSIPVDDHNYNETFNDFQNKLLSMYEGNFLTKYQINNLEEWFIKKYKYYLDEKAIKEKIRNCKGSWKNIELLFNTAIKNYCKWFEQGTEVSNKNKLTKNINEFIYNVFGKTSMFYVCLIHEPTSIREASAEKTYEDIPSFFRMPCQQLFKDEFDGFTFWNKIRNLYKWYKKYYSELMSKDSNCIYWLEDKEKFITDYVQWLLNLTEGDPYISNIGIDNKTFNLFLKQKIKKHNIKIDIPRSL